MTATEELHLAAPQDANDAHDDDCLPYDWNGSYDPQVCYSSSPPFITTHLKSLQTD